MGFVKSGVQVFGRWLINAIKNSFQVALDDMQRRAQFVGDIGCQVTPLLLRAFQFPGHMVKGTGQLVKLPISILRHARG